MLDDLKKERQLGFGAQERLRLSLYVAGLLMLGGVIVVGMRNAGTSTSPKEGEATVTAPREQPTTGPLLDPAEVARRAQADAAEPDRWCDGALSYVLDVQRRGRLGDVEARLDPSVLRRRDLAPDRGHVFEIAGHVTAVAGEAWSPRPDSTGNERLWVVVVEGQGGEPVLCVKYGNRSDVGEGAPFEARPPRVTAAPIEVGQFVLARGVLVQRRTGSFGDTAITAPAPVLWATRFRIETPPEDRRPPVASLSDALWEDVQDYTMRETRKWDEDALFETLQWARAQGYEAVRERILKGDLPWEPWERARFDAWKEEVRAERGALRPLTVGARGRVFRFSGIVGEVLEFGWDRVPRNPFGVDSFEKLTLLSDHYRNVALELFLPYPLHSFPGVHGRPAEHLRLYGVFVKNYSYDTKFERPDGSGGRIPATVPMFVVLHAEPYPEDEAGAAMRTAMIWVAGGMLLFGLVFYLVLIRGGSRQSERMEEHRLALRRRIRAKGQGATLPPPHGDERRTDGGDGDDGA